MSYILDALRKAEAERERERHAVPGLHAQPLTLGDDEPAPPQARAVWLWPAAAGGVLAVALGAWWAAGRDDPAVPPATRPQAALSAAPTPLPPLAAVTPPPQVTSPGANPERGGIPATSVDAWTRATAQASQQGDAAPSPSPASPPAARTSPPPPSDRGRTAAEPVVAAPGLRSVEQPTAERPSASPSTGQDPTRGRIHALHELPPHIRQALPQLVIGGAMYSDSPASRMLIINTQVFREGDRPQPDLTLEEIRLKSAVFAFRGYRYSVGY